MNRRGARFAVAAVAIVVIGVGLVSLAPWNMLRYGRVEPPVVAAAGLESALARRLENATEAVRRDPYDGEAWGRLAGVYDVHDLTAEAVACYERAQTLDPDEFRWPYFLGRATLIDDQARSLAHYRRAAEIRPDDARVHVLIARALLLQGAIDDAETHLARAAAVDPTLIRPHVGLAQVALARGDAAAALEHLAEAQRLGAASREVSLLLADAAERQGDGEAAAAHARAAAAATNDREALPDPLRNELIAREGVTMQFRRRRTQDLLRAGRLDVALSEWEAAVRDDPGSGAARAEYGLLLAQGQRLDDAIIQLQQAVLLDPELHLARNNLGTLLLRKGRTEAGLAELSASCAAMPENADAHLNLAMALGALNRPAEALAAFEQVLRIDPGNLRARFEAGLLLAVTGRLVEATTAFRAVIAADPGRRSAYTNLARALDQLGRHEEAIESLRAGVLRLPDDALLANALAWGLATSPVATARDGAAALAIIQPLCEATAYGDPRLLDTLAAALAETGDFEGAVRYARQAMDLTRAAPAQGSSDARATALEALQRRLDLYAEGRTYRPEG